MESSFIFTYGSLRGIKTATILTADGNIINGTSIYDGNGEEKLFNELQEEESESSHNSDINNKIVEKGEI